MRTVILIALILVLSISCQKDDEVIGAELTKTTDAIIIGYDARRCVCCGGVMLSFKEDNFDKNKYYQWYNFDDFAIKVNNMPYKIRIEYKMDTSVCHSSQGVIKVIDLEILEEKKDDVVSDSSIVGDWQWIKSIAPMTNYTTTPESEKQTRSLIFSSDNIYQELTNKAITYEDKYEIIITTTSCWSNSPHIKYENRRSATGFDFRGDTLFFSEACYDGLERYYLRK